MAEAVVYVYAITPELDADALGYLEGVDETAVRVVVADDLAAVVSSVDAEAFGEQGLRRNLEDMRWLEKTVRGHNRVVEAVAVHSAVAPMGLATVYYDDDRVRDALRERAETFHQVLDGIVGRTEWGVKGYADLDAYSDDSGEPASAAGPEQRPGAAYLSRLRQRRKGRAEAEQESWQRAQQTHAALDELAHASRLHPAQNRELAGYEGVMVLNGAYLVDDTRNEEFAAAVDDLGGRSDALRLELTGPWPAYSFATFQEERQ